MTTSFVTGTNRIIYIVILKSLLWTGANKNVNY